MRRHAWLFVAAATTFVLNCGDSAPPEPEVTPGWLKVRLTTPHAEDGGILFTASGGQIDSVRSSYTNAYVSPIGQNSWRVLVAGNLASGVVAEILVPDVANAADYSASIEQAAARATYVQRSLGGYSLVVER
jgi:hypothetical protein